MGVLDFIADQMLADAFGLEGVFRDAYFSEHQINGGRRSSDGLLLDTFLANAAGLEGDDRDFFFATGAEKPSQATHRKQSSAPPGFYDLPPASPEDKERIRQVLKAYKKDREREVAASTEKKYPQQPDLSEVKRRLKQKEQFQQDEDSLTDDEYMEIIRNRLASQLDQISVLESSEEDAFSTEEKNRFAFVRFASGSKRYIYLCPDLSIWEGDSVLVPFGKNNTIKEAAVIGIITCPSILSPYPVERIKTVIGKKAET